MSTTPKTIVGEYGVECPECTAPIPLPVYAWIEDGDRAHEGRSFMCSHVDTAPMWDHMGLEHPHTIRPV